MALASTIYNALFKRTSTMVLVCVGATFFFERGFDVTAEKIFEQANKGKLWNDIKDKVAQ